MTWITQHLRQAPAPQPITRPTIPPPPQIPSNDEIVRGTPEWYGYLYDEANFSLNEIQSALLIGTCDSIISAKARFQTVERLTGVPWDLIACWQYREKGVDPRDFNYYLGNGDPLVLKTTNVPQGRGPFQTWEAGAVDALDFDKMSGKTDWTPPLKLLRSEQWNGEGYFLYHKDILDPYIWSGTSLYTKGKYGSDGHFDPELVDQQLGVAVILKELKSRGEI